MDGLLCPEAILFCQLFRENMRKGGIYGIFTFWRAIGFCQIGCQNHACMVIRTLSDYHIITRIFAENILCQLLPIDIAFEIYRSKLKPLRRCRLEPKYLQGNGFVQFKYRNDTPVIV